MQYGRDHHTPGPIHWNGKEMDRFDFSTYNEWLFDLYYAAYSQDEFSQRFLLATEDTKLTHKVGKSSPTETILTEREFIDTLVKVRNALKMDKLETDGVISWK